jgi:hypothetical protein
MSDNRISQKAVTLVLVLFVLGIAIGAVGEHMWSAHVLASQRRPGPVAQLKSELQLTGDQATKFEAIIAEQRTKFHELDSQRHAEWAPKYHALDAQRDAEWNPKWDQVRQQGRDQIRAILTPDQVTIFEAFVKKLDEDRRKRAQQEQQQPQQQR